MLSKVTAKNVGDVFLRHAVDICVFSFMAKQLFAAL